VPTIKIGMYCPCTLQRDKVYDTHTKFVVHTKTKLHQKWLQQLNDNKANYYVELLKTKQLVENQQKIIQRLENDLLQKTSALSALIERSSAVVCSVDLLGIN
jgi:hypothetical protein